MISKVMDFLDIIERLHSSRLGFLLGALGLTLLLCSCDAGSQPGVLGSSALNTYHNVDDCNVCHDIHTPSGNLYAVRGSITTPASGDKTVVFTSRTGANSFADGDAVLDGICEVCHTSTNHHLNTAAGDHSHFAATDCMLCHPHNEQFAPSGPGSLGHSTHTSGDPPGPLLVCDDCHGGSPPLLADGEPIETTTVCDDCHSPGGSYDGVGDPVFGARARWFDGVYDEYNQLMAGMEPWCATCHDEAPAASEIGGGGPLAPAVVGDEDASTVYGTGYGYYVTGHGLPTTSTYPASGAAGAGLGCLECHDATWVHLDGVSRSYVPDSIYLDFDPISASYQEGYRLADVSSGYGGVYPLHVPRTGHVFPPGFREDWEFALCLQCHDRDGLFLGMDTWFRDDISGLNLHDAHTDGSNGPWGPTTGQWDSDFDGTAESRMSCPACHNVHGSPAPAMIRHGELIGATPSLDFRYLPTPGTSRASSTGGQIDPDPPWGPGQVANNGVCNMCHAGHVSYERSP